MTFPAETTATLQFQSSVRSTLEVSNAKPITGNTSLPSSEEIRYRSYAAKAAQMRAVTRNDYEAMIYMMPPSLGSVKRASIINDPSSSNRRLSLYIISEDQNNNLVYCNDALKQNIKAWLNKNKMLNDNIDIYNAVIANIGFEYEVVVHPSRDKIEVLNEVTLKLRRELSEKMYIGEPFYLTNVYNIINKVDGVVDTTKVVPYLMFGEDYNAVSFSIPKSNPMMVRT